MRRVLIALTLVAVGGIFIPTVGGAQTAVPPDPTTSGEIRRSPIAESRRQPHNSIVIVARRSVHITEMRQQRRSPDTREFFIVPPQIPFVDLPITALEALATQMSPLWSQLVVAFVFMLLLYTIRRLFPRVPSIQKRIRRPQQLLLLYLCLAGSVLLAGFYWPSGHRLLHITSLFVLLMGTIQALTVIVVDIFFERGRRAHVPVILRNVTVIVIFLVAAVIVLSRFGVDLTGILTGSIVVTAIVGFSLQDTLGSIASGLAIQLERPYVDGDWIKFDSMLGRVLEINWRSTQLLTLNNEIVVIPNKLITADQFVNLSRPEPILRRRIQVGLPYSAPPNECKQLLVAAAQHPLVLDEPKPRAIVLDFSDHAITYCLFFFIRDIRNQEFIDDKVRTNLWYRLKRANIDIPFPIRNITMREVSEADEAIKVRKIIDERIQALLQIPFLRPLNETEREELADSIQSFHYGSGETIIQQGDEGDSLFFIRSGEVEVLIIDAQTGRPRRVALLGAGDFFGEMSLMTGERRTATIKTLTDSEFYVIEARSFREILTDHTAICTQIASILEERQQNLEVKRKEYITNPAETNHPDDDSSVLDRIRHFFGI
jgi:small-conductance mechanosensitive channel